MHDNLTFSFYEKIPCMIIWHFPSTRKKYHAWWFREIDKKPQKSEAESAGNAAETAGNEAETAGHQICPYQIWKKWISMIFPCMMPYIRLQLVQVGLLQMVCNLPSRVFSSDTLIAGVDMVERAEGLQDEQSTQELLAELRKLEVPSSLGMVCECSRNTE